MKFIIFYLHDFRSEVRTLFFLTMPRLEGQVVTVLTSDSRISSSTPDSMDSPLCVAVRRQETDVPRVIPRILDLDPGSVVQDLPMRHAFKRLLSASASMNPGAARMFLSSSSCNCSRVLNFSV